MQPGLKTVIYQSYRTRNVPGWMSRCMETARGWATRQGYEYAFVDDRLFDYVPDWFRRKVEGNKVLMSDLARLELAREFLENGYQRAVWVDADVLVFDPEGFEIDVTDQYGFCREVWLDRAPSGELQASTRVNNAVCVFVADNSLLDFYIHACKKIVADHDGKFLNILIGTVFLTRLYDAIRFPLIDNVGLFSPLVVHGIATGGNATVDAYMRAFGTPVRAGNLCGSYRRRFVNGVFMRDGLYDRAIEMLLATGGDVLNARLPRSP